MVSVFHYRQNRKKRAVDDVNHKQAPGGTSPPEAQHEGGTASSVRTFHLDSTGLRRILGALEADLMEAVWRLTSSSAATSDQGWTTVGAVCQHLGSGYHYKTVQTVMNRLVEKQLFIRRQRHRAFEYRAAITRDELVAQVTRNVVSGLVRDFGEVAIAQLVQTLHDVTPDQLAQLEQLAAASPISADLEDTESANSTVAAEDATAAPDAADKS